MPAARPLRIAWLGGAPVEGGGAPGIVTDLLEGLAERGHRIDCFFPASPRELPERLAKYESLKFVWGTSDWRWDRWYSRTKVGAFATGLFSRGLASVRLRREVVRRHREQPYDLIYQNQSIESLGVPTSLARTLPFVIRPDTHQAGELKCLLREWRLSLRCQPPYVFVVVASIMFVRALVQRVKIRDANLLVAISSVFRDHMVHDYHFPLEHTVVVQNPVNLDRFVNAERGSGEPPVVLVPTRITARKGIEDVVSVAKLLHERGVNARVRIVGGPSLFSDYTKLLEDLPTDNSEWIGKVAHSDMPAEFLRSDVMLLASKFDPCPMVVLEGLAAGVPVVATSEVGSIEQVDRSVAAEVTPGDVEGLVSAITAMLERVRADPHGTRALARAEAERLFAPSVICDQLSAALEGLVTGAEDESSAEVVAAPASPR
ncbi:MAG TPA: glycosyltransferase family 4 protein [Solirubrobacteraceae bacterium]|jgi:glycosyltransferase involved in cell wall biosynthesis|nr:glycosyltransferase family 4 protein [Solirubrobacteraceae bacterium]